MFSPSMRKTKRNLLGLAVLSLFGTMAMAPDQAQAHRVSGKVSKDLGQTPGRSVFQPLQVLVKFKEVAGARAMPKADLGALGLASGPVTTSGGELLYRLSADTMLRIRSLEQGREKTLDIVAQLNQRPDVEYAQVNWVYFPLAAPNDARYPDQWHYLNNGSGAGQSLGGINLPKAWDLTTGSENVVVAIIDTGILKDHPDIKDSPNLVAGYDMMKDSFRAKDGDGRDADPSDPGDATKRGECFFGLFPPEDQPDSWHGTHVAGTVGVVHTNNGLGVAGINWKVKVQPVRVLGRCGGDTADIIDAIRWAAGLPVPGVPNNSTPAKVINMSLGGEQPCSNDPAMQSAINDAVQAGTTVVVAAGNSGADASGFSPAGCNNVVTVAASEARGRLALEDIPNRGTLYSNYGASVEIMAPGGATWRKDFNPNKPDGVLSTVQNDARTKDFYAYYNGTSMASPHVAGVAALVLAREPTLTPAQLLKRLQDTAMPRTAEQCPKPCGAGLLDAFAAVSAGSGVTPPPEPPPTPVPVPVPVPTPEPTPSPVEGPYSYAAKLVCGTQGNAQAMGLARGFYATTINIHNPGTTAAEFSEHLSLGVPPGGAIQMIATHNLEPGKTHAADCDEVQRLLYPNGFPGGYIDGFVVVQSKASLDVTGVYSTAEVGSGGAAGGHSGVSVAPIPERRR